MCAITQRRPWLTGLRVYVLASHMLRQRRYPTAGVGWLFDRLMYDSAQNVPG